MRPASKVPNSLFDDVPPGRRRLMATIKSKDTLPELHVRRLAHRLGYRYALHRRDLPGKPDIVFPARHKVIFVHGCFWHQHSLRECRAATVPRVRQHYWLPKLRANVERDARAIASLRENGWESLVIWECEINDSKMIENTLILFLGPRQSRKSTSLHP